jgi:hypothetical protein
MENTNHAAQLRAQFSYNRIQVLYLTGLTEQQYYEFVTTTLHDWLSIFQPLYTSEDWWRSPSLENWWYFQWNRFDDSILEYLYAANDSKRRYFYRAMHQEKFDPDSPSGHLLLQDFRAQRGRFENELKTLHHETKIQAQP